MERPLFLNQRIIVNSAEKPVSYCRPLLHEIIVLEDHFHITTVRAGEPFDLVASQRELLLYDWFRGLTLLSMGFLSKSVARCLLTYFNGDLLLHVIFLLSIQYCR